MNSIQDELVYKVHKLHIALNEAQSLLSVLGVENACLKKLIKELTNTEMTYQECLSTSSITNDI